jgi:hypothetical protein
MNMNKLLTGIGATLAFTLAAGGTQAVPLSDLFNGGSLIAGDKLFDRWELIFEDASPFTPFPDYSLTDVTPRDDGGNNPGPGINIDFGDQMTVEGDDIYAYIDITFGFRVSTLDGVAAIKDNSLNFDSGSLSRVTDGFNDLGLFVDETVFDSAGNELGRKSIEFSVLDDQQVGDQVSDSAVFDPQAEIFVEKNILVWSQDIGDIAALVSIEQRFSQVPAPATILLVGLGLAGIGVHRRRESAAA